MTEDIVPSVFPSVEMLLHERNLLNKELKLYGSELTKEGKKTYKRAIRYIDKVLRRRSYPTGSGSSLISK
jgi:hypothetical protein